MILILGFVILKSHGTSSNKVSANKTKFYVCFDFDENKKDLFEPNIGQKIANNDSPDGTH